MMTHDECVAYLKQIEFICWEDPVTLGEISLKLGSDGNYDANLQVGSSCWWSIPNELGDFIVNYWKNNLENQNDES